MKLINKIKAYFRKNNKPVELDLRAAEIKDGRAFLHTNGEDPVTYLVRANDVEIRLNNGSSLTDLDILTIRPKAPDKKQEKMETNGKTIHTAKETPSKSGVVYAGDRFRKRTFSMTVYQEEYDMLMESIKEYGYKRADFVLACVNTASKGSMEKAHKKIVKTHKAILLEKQSIAKKQSAKTAISEQVV